eukprot:scaffold22787_cov63-Phaeocystis_antarctica.AAC.1
MQRRLRDPAPGWGEWARSTHDGRHTPPPQPPHQQLTAYTYYSLLQLTTAYYSSRPTHGLQGCSRQPARVCGWVGREGGDPIQQLTIPHTIDQQLTAALLGLQVTAQHIYRSRAILLLRGDVCARLAGHARRPPHARGGWRVMHAARGEWQRHAPDRDQAQAQAQTQIGLGLGLGLRLSLGLRLRLRLGPGLGLGLRLGLGLGLRLGPVLGLGLRLRLWLRLRLGLGLGLRFRRRLEFRFRASKAARVLGSSTTASLRRRPAPIAIHSGPRAAPPWASRGHRPGLDGQRRGNRRLWRRLARAVGAVARRGWASPWEGRAVQGRQARPEEAQEPSWGTAKWGTLTMRPGRRLRTGWRWRWMGDRRTTRCRRR